MDVAPVGLFPQLRTPRSIAWARSWPSGVVQVNPTGPGAARAWAHYLSPWTAWNHVRTVTALAGSTLFILALRAR
jgi:uncharacterized membrane protein